MPAKSKAQQRFMGMVHAAQKGDKAASAKVAKVSKRMKKKDAEDYASTKHKGLPTKVKKEDLMRLISKYGAKRVKEIVKISPELGVKTLTLYAFSTENWKRSAYEVNGLMKLFRGYLQMSVVRVFGSRGSII